MKTKLFLMTILLNSFFMSMNAQTLKSGSLPDITNVSYINVTLDVSELKVNKLPVTQFYKVKGSSEEALRFSILNSIINKSNEKTKKLGFYLADVNDEIESPYLLIVKPQVIDNDGDNTTLYTLINSKDKTEYCVFEDDNEGDNSGSIDINIRASYQRAGGELGAWLRDTYKAQKKGDFNPVDRSLSGKLSNAKDKVTNAASKIGNAFKKK